MSENSPKLWQQWLAQINKLEAQNEELMTQLNAAHTKLYTARYDAGLCRFQGFLSGVLFGGVCVIVAHSFKVL